MSSKRLIRSRWAAIGAAVAVTLGGGGLISVSAVSSNDRVFREVPGYRILDTRQTIGAVSDSTILVQATGVIPVYTNGGILEGEVVRDEATSVDLNLTVTEGVRKGGYGFVTAFPCQSENDAPPNLSAINFVEGVDVANGITVMLGPSGAFCLNVYGTAQLLVDLNGFYVEAETTSLATKKDLQELELRVDGLENSLGEPSDSVDGTPSDPGGSTIPECSSQHMLTFANDELVCASFKYGPASADSLMAATQLSENQALNHQITLAVQEDGRPVIAWRNTTGKLTISRCLDSKCSQTTDLAVAVAPAGTHLGEPHLRLREDGRPFLVATNSLNNGAGPHRIRTLSCEDVNCLTTVEKTHFGDLKDSSAPIDVAIYSDDIPAIIGLTSDGPKLWECNESSCSTDADRYNIGDFSGEIFTSDSSLNLLIFDDDTMMYSYHSWGPQNEVVIGCGGSAAAARTCSGLPREKTEFASQAGGGAYSDLALSPEGLPVFVYSTDGAISIQFCSTKTCEDKNGEVRGAGGAAIYEAVATDEYKDLQIEIAENGVPVITAIRDDVGDSMLVLTCVDLQCSDAHVSDIGVGLQASNGLGLDEFWTTSVRDLVFASSSDGRYMSYGAVTNDGNVHLRLGQIVPPQVAGLRVTS
ncbi:MAG: hypothetical protein ACON40_05405 [Ilumatobacteraceae bacterium]